MFRKSKLDKKYEKAQNHLQKEEYLEARETYLECLALDPDDIGVINNLAQLSNILGEYGKADAYNEILIKECNNQLKHEKNERILILKANALAGLKRNDEANDVVDELLEISPDNTIGLFHKAQYLESKKEYKESLKYLNTILNNDSSNIVALLSKGRILTQLEEYGRAENCFNLILKMETKNKAAVNLKSELLKKKYNITLTPHDLMLQALESWDEKDFKASEEFFQKALTMDSEYDEIWFAQGELLIRKGKITKAINSFKKAFELNPDSGGIVDKKGFFKMLNRMQKINKIMGKEKE